MNRALGIALGLVCGAAALFCVSGAALAEDALEKSKRRGLLTVCADPYIYPYSSQGEFPPGFDIEIIEAIAKDAGMGIEYVWTDTGTRGGLGKALRNSIAKGSCDLFMGIGVDDDGVRELAEKNLVFSAPYLGMGYVLVVQGAAGDARSLEEIRGKHKVGVAMTTPMDAYLFDNEIDRELYNGNRRVMRGMAEGEVDAAMVYSAAIAKALKNHPDAQFRTVEDFAPLPGLRWNLAMAVPAKETALKAFIDESIARMLESGRIEEIVEGYGMPFYPPFQDKS